MTTLLVRPTRPVLRSAVRSTVLLLAVLLSVVCAFGCSQESAPDTPQPVNDRARSTDATASTSEDAPEPTPEPTPEELAATVLELLRERAGDELVVLVDSKVTRPIIDAIPTEAPDLRIEVLNQPNAQYAVQKLFSRLRRNEVVWAVFAAEGEHTDTVRKLFVSQQKTDFDRVFADEGVAVAHVFTELSERAAGEPLIGFQQITREGWMVTDIQFTPDGELLLYSTLNANVKWQRLDLDDPLKAPKGVALELPLLRDGHDVGVYIGGESGMVGMTVSPHFDTDHKIFTHYTWDDGGDKGRRAIVSEWTLDISADAVTARDERVVLALDHPNDLHNAGGMAFGPDGYLYLAIGDGVISESGLKGRGAPHTLRGKILRIDPFGRDEGKQYAVPDDNPFVNETRLPLQPEVWAWGFRNPWRIAFTPDGRLLTGDVGEDRYEKVTFVEKGRHHGWPFVEGLHVRYDWPYGDGYLPVVPVFPYARELGMSVTGGYVYEGEAIEWLRGYYLFSDYLSGRIWDFVPPAADVRLPLTAGLEVRELGRWPVQFTTFGKHPSGDVYVSHSGQVFRIVPLSEGDMSADPLADRSMSQRDAAGLFAAEPPTAEPPPIEVTDAMVALGRRLYTDPRLSPDGAQSCATCHPLDGYGTDGEKHSPGARRNAPTTFNAARQSGMFWDYRVLAVEATGYQAHGMGTSAEFQSALRRVEDYDELFAEAFPLVAGPPTATEAYVALGAFVRSLETRSRWDRYLDGDESALTDAEKKGLATFVSVGCITCHQYRTLGGGMSQKLGLIEPVEGDDKGRSEIDDSVPDYYFKVPGLLNVGETAPYYHDGSITTLEESIEHMARVQLGRDLQPQHVGLIATFLRSLTGERPETAKDE